MMENHITTYIHINENTDKNTLTRSGKSDTLYSSHAHTFFLNESVLSNSSL